MQSTKVAAAQTENRLTKYTLQVDFAKWESVFEKKRGFRLRPLNKALSLQCQSCETAISEIMVSEIKDKEKWDSTTGRLPHQSREGVWIDSQTATPVWKKPHQKYPLRDWHDYWRRIVGHRHIFRNQAPSRQHQSSRIASQGQLLSYIHRAIQWLHHLDPRSFDGGHVVIGHTSRFCKMIVGLVQEMALCCAAHSFGVMPVAVLKTRKKVLSLAKPDSEPMVEIFTLGSWLSNCLAWRMR